MASAHEPTFRLPSTPPSKPGRWRLVVISEAGSSSHALSQKGAVTIGRGDDADIKVDDASASRRHATLHIGDGVRLEDLGSANGTVVRGRRLGPNEIVELGPGDAIELGTTLAVLQPDELSDGAHPWNLLSHAHFLEAVAQARSVFSVLRLQVVAAPGVAQEHLSAALDAGDTVASFGPGLYEVLLPERDAAAARALAERLSTNLVAAGARVRAGHATAPVDGTTADELIAACSRPSSAPAPGFVVRDDAMAALYRLVDRIAPSGINVLLLGETGAGKEVLAGEIHRRSKRAAKPFLRLNCAALTETLLESELFGHVKGAFTGADRNRQGLLEGAGGGTVLLDEIGEISAAVQAKLLRVLEERQVMPVGGNEKRPIDVRFIFATNRDLEAEVARGAFRADLYYRINGIALLIPPLRERLAEIEPLARTFAADAAARDGHPAPEFLPEAVAALKAWHWPGNIRELRNVVDRAVLLAGEGAISPQALSIASGSKKQVEVDALSGTGSLRDQREAAERRTVLEALEKCDGNQTRAAALLGVSRRTLVTRLQTYGMTRQRKKP